jgi:signal transduction histidine kinase
MSRTVEDGEKRPLGRVVIQVLLSRSLEGILLDSTGLGSTGHAYLVDRNRTMLTRSRLMGHPEPGTHKMFSAAIDSALHRGSGTGTYAGWNGEPALGSWQYIPAMDWALIAEMDPSEALADLATLKRNWLIVSLLTLFAVMIIVAVLARSISRPVLDLTRAAEHIARGDLAVRTDVNRSDEIGVLAKTFKQMQAALATSQLSLKDSYQKLIQAERRLAQSEKLAAIGEVVAGVVHELRNPLSAVKMNLKILSRKLKPTDSTFKNVQTAQQQSLKLERMLTQILEYAKPVEPNLAPVDLTQLVRETVENLSHLIEDAGIVVEWDLPPQPVKVVCDRDLISQALTNIIQNAVSATSSKEDGGLKVGVSESDPSSPDVEIEISDNGAGLSPAQIERIFEPFYTTRRDGTGLGLPNAKKMIELHRGHLEVSSIPGEGTSVRIILPRGENDA